MVVGESDPNVLHKCMKFSKKGKSLFSDSNFIPIEN